MIRPQFILDIHEEKIVDNFAGGGGGSTGIERALGRHVDHAINHDPVALGMHRINHPQTIHHCGDVFEKDPEEICEGRPCGLCHSSPDCKHFSKAKGGQPLDKKIRGLVLVMLKWAKYGARVLTMENVEEIETWGPLKRMLKKGKWGWYPDPAHMGRTWRAFLSILTTGIDAGHPDLPEILEVLGGYVTREDCVRGFGYAFEVRKIRACDLGTPTIRKRLYMIARRDGRPIVWPEATHADLKGGGMRTEDGRRLKPYRTIAECIDWHLPCPSIFLDKATARRWRCKRPLAKATLRRIAKGVDRYVLKAERPFIVNLTHQGGDRLESVDEPSKTVTAAHRGEKAVVAPSMMQTGHFSSNSAMVKGADEPLRTQATGGSHALVEANLAPFITEHANATAQRNMPADGPSRTLCAEVKGGHLAMVAGTLVGAGGPAYSGKPKPVDAPMNAQTTENHAAVVAATLVGAGGRAAQSRPRSVDEALHTVTAKGDTCLAAASMVKLRGDNVGQGPDEPGHTISAGGTHHGLVAAYLAQHNGGFNETPGHPAGEPASTISAKGSQQQVVAANLQKYYGNEKEGIEVAAPSHTVTTKDRFGLVESTGVLPMTADQIAGARRVAEFLRGHGVEFEGEFATVHGYVIVDLGMRMLTPRELFRAQGFGEDYVIDRAWVIDPATGAIKEIRLTKEQQIRMCGNSVCPPVMAAIVRANVPEMAVWSDEELRAVGRN